jgi:hypothetical protein
MSLFQRGWRGHLVVLLGLLSLVACERDRTPPVASTAADARATRLRPGAPLASARDASVAPEPARPAVPVPSASAAADMHCPPAAELEQDMGTSFKLRSPLSVVRVAPDDVLWVREKPGPSEKATGKLAHDARGVRATGRVCRAGGASWFEVSAGGVKGWTNGAFLLPTTEPVDETARFATLLGKAQYRNADELVQALRRAIEGARPEPSEGPFEVRLLGVARSNGIVAVLHVCCHADDSVSGQQVWLDLEEEGGRATLRRARASSLCPRGTSGKLCF